MNKKVLIICGPTATGKTYLALELAKLFKGELINADSRQIYKGLDILSGKDIPKSFHFHYSDLFIESFQIGYWEANTRIWLVDLLERNKIFTVYQYQQAVKQIIDDILKRGKLPIIVGGTGLYISSIINPIAVSVPPNYRLRRKLHNLKTSELQDYIKRLNIKMYETLNNSDQSNPRRLTRIIEKTYSQKTSIKNHNQQLDFYKIGLTAPIDFLEKNINDRIDERISRGVLYEIKNSKSSQKNFNPGESVIGFDLLSEVLKGKLTLDTAKKMWFTRDRKYAKRQLTWFKKDTSIHWFDISKQFNIPDVAGQVAAWYTSPNAYKS